jgi:transcriptional regulator with XRE-family HTH domain
VQNIKDEIFLKKLGNRIRELRLKKRLTQADLGFAINNHGEQIGRIERGELNVSSCTLFHISKGLEVDIKELFKFQDN